MIIFLVLVFAFVILKVLMATPAMSASGDETIFYRTKDGSCDIEFWFKNCNTEGWRAYILESINYGTRSTDAHSTHRLHDHVLNLDYVCWTKTLTSKADCQKVAALWSDATMNYIKTGSFFTS